MAVTRTGIILSLSAVNDEYAEKCYIRSIQNGGTANFALQINAGSAFTEPIIRQRTLANTSLFLSFDPPLFVESFRIEAKGTDDVIVELA